METAEQFAGLEKKIAEIEAELGDVVSKGQALIRHDRLADHRSGRPSCIELDNLEELIGPSGGVEP